MARAVWRRFDAFVFQNPGHPTQSSVSVPGSHSFSVSALAYRKYQGGAVNCTNLYYNDAQFRLWIQSFLFQSCSCYNNRVSLSQSWKSLKLQLLFYQVFKDSPLQLCRPIHRGHSTLVPRVSCPSFFPARASHFPKPVLHQHLISVAKIGENPDFLSHIISPP